MALLAAGKYDEVEALGEGDGSPLRREAIAWSHIARGNALQAQAETKDGAKADRLFAEAGEKYQAALAIKPDQHEALNNWGNALQAQAETKDGAEADRLFAEAGEKYQAALAIKPDQHEALNNWGAALASQARTRDGEQRTHLLRLAAEKLGEAERLRPASALYNLACLRALQRHEDAARESLLEAKIHGVLPKRSHIEVDPDFEHLRERAWFKPFLASLGDGSDGEAA